ncbi:MAG TPA: hypothetical protein VGF59_28455 [Bryobacteraceae bacterium]|jgi:hypothetical protein
MKIAATTAAVLAFGVAAHAGGRIPVFVNGNPATLDVMAVAEGISSRIFRTAGVEIEWHLLTPGARGATTEGQIVIDFESKVPADLSHSALAYALPFEGVHIAVLYDRIKFISRDNATLRATILAHVLTHEITHILQGMARHSLAGIMKAYWNPDDYFDMVKAPLRFTQDDIELIRLGCAHKQTPANSPNMDAQ